ncbi:MAG TPA: hypothetical protein VEW67_09485 [Thermoleophilaceae bacterium]|nr:hypothetical protein [Thermoleophilaceae bacterium]
MVILAAGLSIAGCGGSDDSDAGEVARAETAPSAWNPAQEVGYWAAIRLAALDDISPGNTDRSNRGRVGESVNDVQVSLAAGGGQGVCSELTKREMRRIAIRWAGEPPVDGDGVRGCKDAVIAIARQRKQARLKTKISHVQAVRVDGNRAVAELEDPDGTVHEARYVEEKRYGWNLDDLEGVDPDAGRFIDAEGPG